MTVELSAEDIEIICNLIQRRIENLGPEIHHTRTPDYHEDLKQFRESLKALHQRLGHVAA